MMLFSLRQRFLILAVTLGTILAFSGAGLWVGSRLGNPGAGALVGAVLSFPFTQAFVAKAMRKEGERIAETTESYE